MFMKNWRLEYWKVIKTYLPTYQWDRSGSSYICDSCDSCDSSDSSDRGDSSDSSDSNDEKFFDQNFVTKILWLKFLD